MAETINTQTTGYECVGIEKIEQTYEGLFDNKPNIITIYLTNGDTHQFKVMNGSQGVGIDRIEQRQTSTVSGGRNEFAIILTNGKEYTFSTYNGSGGSGSSGSFNQVLQQLNNLLMPSGKSYLYYNGSGFEWKSPDGSTGGGTADLSEYSWWGRKFDPASKSITGEMSSVTCIEFQSTNGETVIRKKLHLDKNGDLCFDGNLYATGGITALGVGTTTGGGSSSSSRYPLTIYNGSSNTDYITYDGSSAAYLRFKSGFSISKTGLGYEISVSGGGSGSTDSRIDKIKLFNSLGESFETVNLGSANTIGFMAGDNITLEAIVKEYTNVIKISAKGGNGGSGGSTSTSVSWSDVTNKPSTFTPSSHTHSTSDINGLSNYVQSTKVDNATTADKAVRLAVPRRIWGQNFNGADNISGNLYMDSAEGGSIQLWMNSGNMLDRTNNTLHIGYGLKESSDGEINLDANVTKIYTDNYSKHYDFKSNVFDVNSNHIHFGSTDNGGSISWDAANNAFKIEGNVYATGGITALGVSNNATTSNNVDFTFGSVTSKRNIIYADDNVPFKIYPKNNTKAALLFSYNGKNWSIYDDNYEDLYLQAECHIDSDGWIYSPQFLCYEYGNMELDGASFHLGDTDNNVDVVFYYNGSSYKLDMSKAISVGVFATLSTQELSALQERKTKKKAVL